MIKLIVFDLVGVLVREKNIEMNFEESKIEKLFGPNKCDEDYIDESLKIISNKEKLIDITINLLDRLYEVKDVDLFNRLKKEYPDIKLSIGTNHVSFIKKFINDSFDIDYLDYIFISADINKIKPNNDFYEEIISKTKYNPNEILFLDDNKDNIDGAVRCGLKTIKVEKNADVFKEIKDYIK